MTPGQDLLTMAYFTSIQKFYAYNIVAAVLSVNKLYDVLLTQSIFAVYLEIDGKFYKCLFFLPQM